MGDLRNPYKGLRAFQEADAPDFFGRARLAERILDRLRGTRPVDRLVAVVGPSGSGKTSVVRAGVLPALRQGALTNSSQWFVTSMMPGAHPFEELAAALQRVSSVPVTVDHSGSDFGAGSRRAIARAVKQALPGETDELLLVIDQFEELFTLCADDTLRHSFIAELVDAVNDPRSRVRVLVTLRAGFYDRPLAADVIDQPGALPLLQYALTEVFEQQVSGLMTVSAYESIGGLTGALARRAEQLYEEGSQAEQSATRRLFQFALVVGGPLLCRLQSTAAVGLPAGSARSRRVDDPYRTRRTRRRRRARADADECHDHRLVSRRRSCADRKESRGRHHTRRGAHCPPGWSDALRVECPSRFGHRHGDFPRRATTRGRRGARTRVLRR